MKKKMHKNTILASCSLQAFAENTLFCSRQTEMHLNRLYTEAWWNVRERQKYTDSLEILCF